MTDTAALAELERHVLDLRAAAGQASNARVNLLAVADQLGVSVRHRPSVSEGQLTLKGGRAVIEIDPSVPPARLAFTLAHELGHAYLLHPRRGLSIDVYRRWPDTEAFCNDFAATMLLPTVWLKQATAGRRPSLELLMEVATGAGTSLSATSVRLLRAGLWSSLLLWWRTAEGAWSLYQPGGVALRSQKPLTAALNRRPPLLPEVTDLWLENQVGRLDRRTIRLDVRVGSSTLLALVPLEPWDRAWRPRWRTAHTTRLT